MYYFFQVTRNWKVLKNAKVNVCSCSYHLKLLYVFVVVFTLTTAQSLAALESLDSFLVV